MIHCSYFLVRSFGDSHRRDYFNFNNFKKIDTFEFDDFKGRVSRDWVGVNMYDVRGEVTHEKGRKYE